MGELSVLLFCIYLTPVLIAVCGLVFLRKIMHR